MWAVTLIAMAALTASGDSTPAAPRERADSTQACCVQAALRELPVRRTITVVCRDGSWVQGEFLGLDDARGTIRLRQDPDPVWFTATDWRDAPQAVRTQDVARLQWRAADARSVAVPLFGLLLGAALGYAAGRATNEDGTTFIGLCPLGGSIAGTCLGGALGMAVGVALTPDSHRWHSIECPPGDLSAARSASAR